ncbi:MAG: hypothetical protein U0Z44_22605 [Kouleothrix sp.]|jgi:hypothetical protein|nr:hypothetical protein [Kouleothrix sp.]
MQHFPQHTNLGDGYTWTARFDSHDYARMCNFYFTLSIWHGSTCIKQLPVETFDYSYGDANCTYTDDEIRAHVHDTLHRTAAEHRPA